MKTPRSRPIVLAIAALVLALASSSTPAQEKAPKADAPDATSFAYAAPTFIKELDTRYPAQPAVPPAPRYGGVLHFPATVRTFDPTAGYRPELALVWDTLTEWEATWYFPEVQRTPVIRKTLATSWEMVNPSTWIFKLRQGVRFHNRPPVNGREMTAEDVKYSYELLRDKVQYATRAALVKTIHVVDKYTVKFELAMPDPKFYLNVVDSLSPVIVPREAVEAPGGLAENPIGTGAFMLKEFAPGEGALLVRNPDYYLKDKDGRALPYVDAVRLFFTKDRATDMALFRARQIDLMRVPTLDVLYALMKTTPDLQLYRVPSFGWGDYGVSLALDKPPFNDVRVRQALSMAINRDVVAEVINRGDATLYGPFPWGARRLHEARGLFLREPRAELSIQREESQRAAGGCGLSLRIRDGAGVGGVRGLDVQRVRPARRALLERRGRAREAQAARDIRVDQQDRRRAALHAGDRRRQSDRRRAELHGLDVSALPFFVPKDGQPRRHQRS
jgi:ABC-type transport system substrate-binding protein